MERQWLFWCAGTGFGVVAFAVGLLLTRTGKNRERNLTLSLFLVCCLLNLSHPLIIQSDDLVEPLEFLMAPLFAAYIRTMLCGTFPTKREAFIHGIPFIVLATLSLMPEMAVLSWGTLLVQMMIYLVPVSRKIHRYARKLREEVSNLDGVDPNWLRWLLVAFLCLYLFFGIVLALKLHMTPFSPVRNLIVPALTIFVIALSFRGLLQKTPPEAIVNPSLTKERPVVTEREAERIRMLLDRALSEEKLYLDPELSLSDLANHIDVPRNTLSWVINRVPGRNFYDLIGECRIREVQAKMADPGQIGQKILSLALDAGFASKPTFNVVFKKVTGMTPSEFRSKIVF
ncbi:MAG: hypothetical protein A2087_10915 [Spirochaetes bacterium GWD1_61_31]|nr:MAG: hypothetical protein A2Y37_06920 [Spirochaetes bacterium GWB1_60_80]OHD30806.1 MAG: hypothetical protein A2004_04445 [Spirochaetes bacterium GWC1_61_12]OHD36403.1 MAG: hypothetical protein A2087_10915 [Spirochaetes bacterium GWD1_61_31]OHD46306.1 MAG: hypothetical protein A2Y35_07195 [Spirochaetes bacterium GWE1_60_18]OHD60913.1 MAG: hypothetical protein A2Y32_11940 [Spirochaetes bacterium GWF1_60_12]HAP42829.1 hypothetical protein [Spirochaetaceae bacterium]